MKRQTINANRAVAVVEIDTLPADPGPFLKRIKRAVAFRCGFFPFFYGIGTQLVLVISGPTHPSEEVARMVDRYDNHWSIIQSVFIVQAGVGLVATARTWGQYVTGKYQDVIEAVLARPDKS